MKTRDVSIDALCGLLIIHMIVGHIFEWASLTDTDCYIWQQRIFFFFMPWFFFKSGMFYKEKSFHQSVMMSYRRLIVPLFYFSLLGLPCYWMKLYLNGDINIIHYLLSPLKSLIIVGNNAANLPLWFLLALFCVSVINSIILKRVNPKYVLLFSFVLAAVIECLINISVPHYVPNVLLGISFYITGYFFSGLRNKCSIGIICLILYASSVLFFPQYVDFRSNKLIYGNYLLWFLVSNVSCIAFNYLFRNILRFYQPKLLINVGSDSLIYFALHWLVISYTTLFLNSFLDVSKGWKMWSILLFVNIIILPLCAKIFKSNKLRVIIGK